MSRDDERNSNSNANDPSKFEPETEEGQQDEEFEAEGGEEQEEEGEEEEDPQEEGGDDEVSMDTIEDEAREPPKVARREPTSVRLVKVLALNPKASVDELVETSGMSPAQIKSILSDMAKMYLSIVTSDDPHPVKRLLEHYGSSIMPEQIERIVPRLEMEKNKLITKAKAQNGTSIVYRSSSKTDASSNQHQQQQPPRNPAESSSSSLPFAAMDQQIPPPYGQPSAAPGSPFSPGMMMGGADPRQQQQAQQQTGYSSSMSAAEIRTKEMALRYAMDANPMVSERQKEAVMKMYYINPQEYNDNPAQLLALLSGILLTRAQPVFQSYMLITNKMAQDENAFINAVQQMGWMGGSMPGAMYNPAGMAAAGSQSTSFFNPMAGVPSAAPGMMGGMPRMQPGMYPPQFQQMLEQQQYEWAMKKAQQAQEDERMEREFRNVYRIFQLKFMQEAMAQKSQSPFGAFGGGMMPGNVNVHVTRDPQTGQETVTYSPAPQQQQQPVNPLGNGIGEILGIIANQYNSTLQLLAQNNSGKEFKDLALKMMDAKPQDPFEFMAKMKTAMPEAFGKGSGFSTPDQLKLEFDAKLAMMDRQIDLERWRAEREEKREEKQWQQASMNKYVDSLREIGTDILKPFANKVADGISSRLQQGQPQQQQPQQPQQAQAQFAQMPDLSKMSDEEFAGVMKERQQAVQQLNQNAAEIQRRILLVDQEAARRQALKNQQNMQARAAVEMPIHAGGSAPPVTTNFAGLGSGSSSQDENNNNNTSSSSSASSASSSAGPRT